MSETPAPEFLALQAAVAGRYVLERELGRGGMGVVYLARDIALERPVAIKLLPPAVAAHAGIQEAFLREARLAASLSHPNIVSIHLVEARDDLVYFVMAFVEGETLAQRVRRSGPLSVPEATRVLQEVAWALAYAHGRGRGIVHRDVKPENILLERESGRALVMDFGIAHRADAATGVAGRGEVIGTAHYMSPEQAAGEAVDARSDLYSLGVTGFVALTGRLPFDGPTPQAILAQHLTQAPPPIATLRPALPRRLAEAIDRCLAKEPAARFGSGEELAEAIGAVRDSAPSVPPLVRRFQRAVQLVLLLAWAVLIVTTWTRLMAPASTGAVGGLFLAVWGVALLDLLSHARLLVRAGCSGPDVAAGFLAEARTRREEDAEFVPQGGRRSQRLLAGLVRPAVLVGAAGGALGALALAVYLPALGVRSALPRVILAFTGTFVPALLVPVVLAAPQLAGRAEGTRTGTLADFWSRLWSGWAGRALFAVAGVGVRRTRRAGPTAQPTETLLRGAVTSLIASLPPGYQDGLSDVTEVVRRLEARVQSERRRSRGLSQAIAAAGPAPGNPRLADLEAARREADTGLAAALTALENLRLALLKARAGVGSPTELAADVEAARRYT